MPRAKKEPTAANAGDVSSPDVPTPQWTPEDLLACRNYGPGLIGQEKFDAVQAYIASTAGGRFGPALLGSKAHSQAAPIRFENGVPIFAE